MANRSTLFVGIRLCALMICLHASIASAQVGTSAPGQAPARDTSAKTGTASIRGHVFNAATGAPLRKAQVRAFAAELRENRLVSTDVNGAYEIKNLNAGRYQVTATKGSLIALSYGQTRPFEPGKPVDVANGQSVERIDFRLPQGSVVTGHVVDEFGETTPDVQVTAMRYQYAQGRRQLAPAGRPAITNDLGQFRLFGLAPGQYYVSATLRTLTPDGATDDRAGYAPTYFPGTANFAEAQRVTIAASQTINDINVTLSPARLARVSGTAVDSEGKPLGGAIAALIQTTGSTANMAGAGQIRPDGSFSIANVAPGEYSLRAISNTGGLLTGGEQVATNITVAETDLLDIRLEGIKPSTVTGQIILPQGLKERMSNVASLQIWALPAKPELLNQPSVARFTNDVGNFELKVQPGRQLIRMNAIGPFANMRLRAVRVNGVDVMDSGIDVRAKEDLSGLEVELTAELSTLSGFVTNAKGEKLKDYTVVVFPRDRERSGYASRYVNEGRADQEGQYKLIGLPQGDYLAIALDYVEQGAATDQEFLDSLRDRATAFTLRDGETKSLELRLVPGL